jgi:hypothetical protein
MLIASRSFALDKSEKGNRNNTIVAAEGDSMTRLPRRGSSLTSWSRLASPSSSAVEIKCSVRGYDNPDYDNLVYTILRRSPDCVTVINPSIVLRSSSI